MVLENQGKAKTKIYVSNFRTSDFHCHSQSLHKALFFCIWLLIPYVCALRGRKNYAVTSLKISASTTPGPFNSQIPPARKWSWLMRVEEQRGMTLKTGIREGKVHEDSRCVDFTVNTSNPKQVIATTSNFYIFNDTAESNFFP